MIPASNHTLGGDFSFKIMVRNFGCIENLFVSLYSQKQYNMKRYWLFMYEGFEPNGGMCDFIGDFNTKPQVSRSALKANQINSHLTYKFHVLDTHARLVYEYDIENGFGVSWSLETFQINKLHE